MMVLLPFAYVNFAPITSLRSASVRGSESVIVVPLWVTVFELPLIHVCLARRSPAIINWVPKNGAVSSKYFPLFDLIDAENINRLLANKWVFALCPVILRP